MGLDGVEMVMAIEEHFGIELTDAEVQAARTVRELAGVVAGKVWVEGAVGGDEECGCPKGARFYELRRRLCGALGVERSAVRPSTGLGALGLTRRGSDAVAAVRCAGIGLPGFVPAAGRGRLAERTGGIVASVVVVGCCAAVWGPMVSVGSDWLFIVVGLMMFVVWVVVSGLVYERFCTRLPVGCETVGDLVVLEDAGLVPLRTDSRAALERSVLERVRILVAEQMGVHPAGVTGETRFVEDLGF